MNEAYTKYLRCALNTDDTIHSQKKSFFPTLVSILFIRRDTDMQNALSHEKIQLNEYLRMIDYYFRHTSREWSIGVKLNSMYVYISDQSFQPAITTFTLKKGPKHGKNINKTGSSQKNNKTPANQKENNKCFWANYYDWAHRCQWGRRHGLEGREGAHNLGGGKDADLLVGAWDRSRVGGQYSQDRCSLYSGARTRLPDIGRCHYDRVWGAREGGRRDYVLHRNVLMQRVGGRARLLSQRLNGQEL